MSQFLGVHKLDQMDMASDQELADGFHKYKEAAAKLGLNATHAHYSLEKGFAYCLTEAENADQVRQAHADAQNPLEDVIEVKSIE